VRGAALIALNSISWLATKPEVLDVPDRETVAAGVHLTEDSRSELRRYVVVFMPGAFALAGVGIALARRASERKPQKNQKKKKKEK
jgi:hypothetical protein